MAFWWLSIEFGEISKIGKQTEQAGKLGKKPEWKYGISYFSPKFTKSHLLHFYIILHFLSLSKYVVLYFPACNDANYIFLFWDTEI